MNDFMIQEVKRYKDAFEQGVDTVTHEERDVIFDAKGNMYFVHVEVKIERA